MSGGILFLAHRIPFPPDRGDKIRSHHFLKHLAGIAPVHVGCLADDEADMAQEAELVHIAASHCLVRRSLPVPLAGLLALARRETVSLAAFRDKALQAWVDETLQREAIDTIHVFSGQMGQYVPAGWTGRLIVDLVDVDSAKFEAYAQTGHGPRRWIDAREGRLLRAEEQCLAMRADHTLLISAEEAALFRSRLDGGAEADIRAIANGIDCDFFDPARTQPHPDLSAAQAPQIIFTGQMDYAPNVAAAQRLAHNIMPLVRRHYPEAQCHIVGRNPAEAVRAVDGVNGCKVWGGVPDMRPFLAAADLALVPLDIARGVQNKVLEAMAMALPVVLSPGAATGISGHDGTHFAIGPSDEQLADHALRLIGDRQASRGMGEAARSFVKQAYSWDGVLAGLDELLGLSIRTEAGHVAA